ncbi:hypothetical protein QPK32_12455 [Massilia sp. YIM B02763]|uniref:hypothetical protein n=1 Tax=Massilia sp. YIM B02763 TaxID=3050130 RepID=UPI0025B62E7A|nr:hypothetical protein [Massilia sp. YIM B02763]MDN4053890.1 hypothetical protein [Massilia sp. YIM B02763]
MDEVRGRGDGGAGEGKALAAVHDVSRSMAAGGGNRLILADYLRRVPGRRQDAGQGCAPTPIGGASPVMACQNVPRNSASRRMGMMFAPLGDLVRWMIARR